MQMKRKSSILLIILVILGLTYGSIHSVGAHDWYSPACCSSHDCHPIMDCSEITEAAKGVDWQGFHFDPNQIHPSEDNKCHVCIHEYEDILRPICIYTQQGS